MEPQTLQSFLEVSEHSDFSLRNIPFGVFSEKTNLTHQRPATRIGILIKII
jgi:hypothetical protein